MLNARVVSELDTVAMVVPTAMKYGRWQARRRQNINVMVLIDFLYRPVMN